MPHSSGIGFGDAATEFIENDATTRDVNRGSVTTYNWAWHALTVLIMCYFAITAYSIYQLAVPTTCKPGEHCVYPILSPHTQLDIYVFVSTSKKRSIKSVAQLDKAVLVLQGISQHEEIHKRIKFTPPRAVYNNATLHVHVFATRAGNSIVEGDKNYLHDEVIHKTSRLTQHRPTRRQQRLLVSEDPVETSSSIDQTENPRRDSSVVEHDGNDVLYTRYINHIRQHVTILFVPDDQEYSITNLPVAMEVRKYRHYRPVTAIADVFLTSSDWTPIPDTSSDKLKHLQFTFTFRPTSIGLYRILSSIQDGLEKMQDLGFSAKDMEDIRNLFFRNSPFVLALTYAVTILHLCFDYLAFKNDIGFWRGRKDFVGLSRWAVVFRFFSTFIILLYLIDFQEASFIIIGVTGLSVIVEAWKVTKILRSFVTWHGWIPRYSAPSFTKAELETNDYDTQAIRFLSLAMIPLTVCLAVYSLLYVPHRSWWSWLISSLANGIYMFGFVFMTPQLFINYKLKSVAHLPWRALLYKSFNTFIDDIFAFIIHMPTAHRLACLRDDIVFLIYLYQKWLYPIDFSRVNEFGYSFDNISDKKEKKE
eukprot:gene4922-119_t